jgi:subtilase family serine protease
MSVHSLTSPQFTGSAASHFLAPDDFATIYDLKPLYNANYEGSGQRIVVIGQSAVDVNDIRVFRLLYGLSDNDPQVMLVPGSEDPGNTPDEIEADLDIEWAGAIARNAKIIYVYSSDARVAVYYAINQNLGSIISYSFGICEQKISATALDVTRALAQQANAQGMTWLAASGDSGAAACDSVTKNKASLGLGVSFPASLPEVTGVGGTQFDEADGVY